jgi:phospholipid transport system substrate-binding protein
MIDFRELGKRALGDAWDERDAAEKDEFVRLLGQLMQRSYRDGLESTLRYEIRVVGSSSEGGETVVQTSAQNRENRREPAIEIAYRIYRAGDELQVVDVITDGVSMLRNYRRQFRRILRREGWEGLISRMRERAAESAN